VGCSTRLIADRAASAACWPSQALCSPSRDGRGHIVVSVGLTV